MGIHYDIISNYLIKSNYRPLIAGDDYDHGFRTLRNGVPLDLTGSKLWFTVKSELQDPDSEALLQYTSEDNIFISSPTQGTFTVKFQAADTSSLAGTWHYDIQAKLSTDKIITLAYGVIEFLPQVTLTRN